MVRVLTRASRPSPLAQGAGMISKCKSLSAAEYLGGGLALAIVALIAFGSAHIARPRAPVPATPVHYATAAIGSSEAAAKSSIEQQDRPPNSAAESRNAHVSAPASDNTAALRPAAPDRATAPSPPSLPPAAVPSVPVTTRFVELGARNAADIQQQVTEARSLGGSVDAARTSPPADPRPDRRFADAQPRHAPDPASERAAPTFVGGWSDDIRRCRPGRETPLVITPRAAKTAGGECHFGFVRREAANQWRVSALCTSEGQFWRANIALKLVEPNLTWSSERGSETYVRCRR